MRPQENELAFTITSPGLDRDLRCPLGMLLQSYPFLSVHAGRQEFRLRGHSKLAPQADEMIGSVD